MQPNLFNAHIELRRILLGKSPTPFTPIQAFGLPFNEYLVASPRFQKPTEDSNVSISR